MTSSLTYAEYSFCNFQPVRFDKESMDRGLPVLEAANVSIPGADQNDRGLWG